MKFCLKIFNDYYLSFVASHFRLLKILLVPFVIVVTTIVPLGHTSSLAFLQQWTQWQSSSWSTCMLFCERVNGFELNGDIV